MAITTTMLATAAAVATAVAGATSTAVAVKSAHDQKKAARAQVKKMSEETKDSLRKALKHQAQNDLKDL